jgi:hypothetical protein
MREQLARTFNRSNRAWRNAGAREFGDQCHPAFLQCRAYERHVDRARVTNVTARDKR